MNFSLSIILSFSMIVSATDQPPIILGRTIEVVREEGDDEPPPFGV